MAGAGEAKKKKLNESKSHEVKIFVDVSTVVTVTSSANSYIDAITTEISKTIGKELEAESSKD